MGHIQTIEANLRDLLEEGDAEKTVRWVKERVLESYRNGLKGQGKTAPSRKQKRKKSAEKSED